METEVLDLGVPESLTNALLGTDFELTSQSKLNNLLKHNAKDRGVIQNNIDEFVNNDRKLRKTQTGNLIEDKLIGEGEKQKLVLSNRVTVPLQKKIVLFSAAFEAGMPVEITHNDSNNLFDEVIAYWRDKLRIDDLFLKAKIRQKSETQCAIQFYIIKSLKEDKEVTLMKAKLLLNEKGDMCPIFDDYDNLVAFVWRFSKKEDNKTVNYCWVFDELNCSKFRSDGESNFTFVEALPHGFDVIPIVYLDQEAVEWEDVKTLIDRYEIILSRLGGSNDYSAYPILKIFGDLLNAPEKGDDGKVLRFNQEAIGDESNPKVLQGDAQFLTADNAAESIKLEFDKLEAAIFSNTSTPNLAFDNIKASIGNISGIALRMLFLDSEIKALLNQGENRTALQRIFNVIASGICETINTKLNSNRENLKPLFTFKSIVPEDVSNLIENLSTAKTAGFISTETAVKKANMVPQDMVEEEVNRINGEGSQQP